MTDSKKKLEMTEMYVCASWRGDILLKCCNYISISEGIKVLLIDTILFGKYLTSPTFVGLTIFIVLVFCSMIVKLK